MKTKLKGSLAVFLCTGALAFVGLSTETVWADGSEGGLGAPGIAVAAGSGIVVAGTGAETQPAIIDINVPGTSVAQALLYWTGEGDSPGDDTIDVDFDAGSISIAGDLIGGPTFFFNAGSAIYLTTYRADVSSFISTGANSLSITGMDYSFSNSGAGLLVIYDDGSATGIDIRDGQDLAFARFTPPLRETVPQLFTFDSAGSSRTATLSMFFASVGTGALRPTLLRTTTDGEVTEYFNLLSGADGANWDTLSLPVNIPAFATSVLVEAISWEDGLGNLPASLGWVTAALTMAEPPPSGDGCTPGFWKQLQHLPRWTGFAPTEIFSDVFGVGPAITLFEAVNLRGGGVNRLMAHAVAAILNASNPDVDYAFSVAEIIALVQDAFATGEFRAAKNILVAENERGCPIDAVCGDGFCQGGENSTNCEIDCACVTPADCDDGVACTIDDCVGSACQSTPDNSACADDGQFCNGTEFCDADIGCSSTGNTCGAAATCNETTATCNSCVPKNDSCTSDAECCSGICKNNGRCR